MALGPLDEATFKKRLEGIIEGYAKGKDRDKLRIIVTKEGGM